MDHAMQSGRRVQRAWFWLAAAIAAALLAGGPATADDAGKGKAPARSVDRVLFDLLDTNHDGKVGADEISNISRQAFNRLDADHDGYLDVDELARAAGAEARRGKAIANELIVVADDFVVDVYHNGERVPDDRRTLLVERFGATAEKIKVDVREGDWLVFNVVNNRLRWGGARYFAVTGRGDGGVAFTTEPTSGRWSFCDDPGRVKSFIADRSSLANQLAQPIENPWGEGDGLMNQLADGWSGQPVWGRERNTWIKFVARRVEP